MIFPVTTIGYNAFYGTSLKKTIWLTNTPPSGYTNAAGTINYVANEQYTSLSNKTVYPFLSSIFEVDGVKYVPVSPSERTCDAIDCVFDSTATNIHIGNKVTYKGVSLSVLSMKPYTCYNNHFIHNVQLGFDGNIGDYAFYSCDSISNVIVEVNGNIGNSAFSGITTNCEVIINNTGNIGSKAFYNSRGLKSVILGDSVKGYIGSNAFQNCTSLETAELGENITSIGTYAFESCGKLQSIIIPDSTKAIGQYAFSNCSALSNVHIGTKVKEIGTYAFQNCKSLPSISIPQATTDINDYVFSGCTSLKTVLIEDREAELKLGSNGSSPLFSSCPLDSVYIGGNITYYTSKDKGYSPFYRNATLRSVTITDKETEISPNEFYGCTNLQNVRIGDGVTTIGDWAFSGCFSLSYFAFGTQVNNIGKEAFSDCTNVGRIISKAEVPPVCGSQALDDINKWNCQLSVPEGCLSAYQAADQWKEFFFVDEKALEEGIIDNPESPDTPGTLKCATPTIAFANGKLTFTCATEGVEYAYEVTNADVKKGHANEVAINGTYKVSVYAIKPGYENSEVATMEFTLGGNGNVCDVNHDGKVDVADIATILTEMAARVRMQGETEE